MDPVSRTRELASLYFDGRLSPAELGELQALLARPEAADAFARASRVEAGLRDLFAHEQAVRDESDAVEAIGRRFRRRRALARAARLALAACVLFAALVGLLAWLARDRPAPPTPREVEVAGALERRDGVARVTSAEASFRTADGSRVRLQRGGAFVVPTAGAGRVVEILDGVAHFEVAPAAEGFRVETPAGRVTALGTSFTVSLTHEPEDEIMRPSHLLLAVVVLTGEVLVEAGGQSALLVGGQSRAFAQDRPRDGDRKEGERPAARPERGTVTEVGDKKLTLAGGERREGVTLDVPEAAKVFVDGKPAKLSDLAKGMAVAIEKGERGAVVAVRAEGPTVGALLKGVGKDELTVEGRRTERAPAADVVYALSKDAKFTIDGKAGTAADLKAGDRVGLKLSADQKTILAVVKGRGDDREGEGRENPRQGRTGGEVTSVDEKANAIAVKTERGENKYEVAKDARVTIDGRAGKLGDVKKGDRVTLLLGRDGKTVVAVAKGPRDGEARRGAINGTVMGTEKKDATITVLVGDAQEERVFGLAKDVKVTVQGRDGKLEDVKEKAQVRLTLGRDEKTVVEIAVGRGRGEREGVRGGRVLGKVKGAEKTDSTITLYGGREKPQDQLFAVAKDAKVTVNGKPAKLEDVKEGMEATLILDEDRKTVKEIVVAPARRRE